MNTENTDQLDPELEKLLKEVKLKEPPQDKMADYLAGVHAKIDRGPVGSGFGFPQMSLLLAAGLALMGLLYFLVVSPQRPPVPQVQEMTREAREAESLPAAVSTTLEVESALAPSDLSIEEEITVFEELGEGFTDEAIDLFEEDELLEELALVDELELSLVSSPQAPAV